MSLKDEVVCVIDNGMFIELAIRLSRDFKHVYYFSDWVSEYPVSKDDRIGYGVPEIERISTFWDRMDEIDCFVFPSIYKADWQLLLEDLGKRVFGSRTGDALEIDRWDANKKFTDLGLPRPTMTRIKGMDKLREHLDPLEDKWIKVSKYRGGNETWNYLSKDLSRRKLNEIEADLGEEAKIFEFLVEDPIEGEEWGSDLPITVDGMFPEYVLLGVEKKDCCYLGKVKKYSEISPLITDFNTKIAPTLKKRRYRNMMSTEIRITKDKTPYMIDFTARMPSPPGEIYLELITNISEVIWGASEGRLVEPEYAAKYAMEVMINSDAAQNDWVTIYFPESIRKWVKLRNLAIIDGNYCIVPRHPNFENIGAVIAIGNTVEEVEKKAKSYCEQIKGEDVECKVGDISKVMEIIEGGKKLGINW